MRNTILIGIILMVGGCIGSPSTNTHDSLNSGNPSVDSSDPSSRPYTDAYIEFPGPSEKWVGPQNFILHLSVAGKDRKPELTVSPTRFFPEDSSAKKHEMTLTLEEAREEIAALGAALKEQKESPKEPQKVLTEESPSCLLLVRVKLIRSDGVLLSRQGCRRQSGWVQMSSELVDRWLRAVYY